MAVLVYQTFEIKQDKYKEAINNLREIKKFRNDHYDQKVEILTPVTGQDHTYTFLTTYEGLAEMELQGKKMFEDEEYIELIGEFFLENIVQGSMYTQIFRTLSEKESDKKGNKK
ncbi:hypothetical protein [Bacillus sp. UNC438CL73TsuS30]|uniref:hypothetical protein n=1 Tax=Bacillus sp. UNC438CL73TsuS30 TaxID=1340434 RepID=UPI00047E4CB9|nr:hypothetical protein [Bacillus sp. UNC438CL73TsuS30]